MLVVALYAHHWVTGFQALAFEDLALTGIEKQYRGKPQVKRNSVGDVTI